MRKILIMTFIYVIISTLSYTATVYDPKNHITNKQIQQQTYLQYAQQVKQFTEEALQTQHQLQMLANDASNLSAYTNLFLDTESNENSKAVLNLFEAQKNSESLMRKSSNFNTNYDKMFKTDKYKNMSAEELKKEAEKISREMANNSKTSANIATLATEEAEKVSKRLTNFSKSTNGAKGNLESQQAIKSVNENQATTMTQLLQINSERLRLESLRVQKEETEKELEEELAKKNFGELTGKDIKFGK